MDQIKIGKFISELLVSILSIVMMLRSFTVSKTFQYNWNIYLPNDFKEVYHTKSEVSFHGDGERYSVFEGSRFFGEMKTEKNMEMEESVEKIYDNLKVPKEQQIDFGKAYSWIKITGEVDDRNYMYCIYSYETSNYYFYEWFM